MQIVNSPYEDNHMHSSNFSDGQSEVDAIVYYAGRIGLKIITITDHSQAILDYYKHEERLNMPRSDRRAILRWENPYDNGVEVRFGLEADLMDENGRICDYIGNPKRANPEEKIILSAHKNAYQGDQTKVTQGLIKAIKKHGKRIIAIGHPCSIWDLAAQTNIRELCNAANDYGVPLEFNGKNFAKGNTDMGQLDELLKHADTLMVNSDAHWLAELNTRRAAFKYLEERGLFVLE